ncbi:Bystin-domain-containing protein [Calycina marina]|uniref:Bystin-domain-containing protein n=1 Tax=Calycina marina TaxID=1763456 RepID=A0A9P8CHV0_9HELO|nr:Bystin-domain-containing protein [Calycina marina]
MPKTSILDVRESRNPLEAEYKATVSTKTKSTKRKSRADEDEEKFVGSKASRKILGMAQELADEDDNQEIGQFQKPNPAFDFNSRFDDDQEEQVGDHDAWGDEDEVEEIEIAPGDREIFERFHQEGEDPSNILASWGGGGEPQEDGQTRNLADLIMEKINAFEAAQDGQNRGPGPIDEDFEIPPKVVEVYMKVGLILSRYKSGKLPKPFKILPTVPHWENIIQITRPDKWTANACLEATRIFVSSKPHVAQRFFEMVLLDKVREDIAETKKLNVHLFTALKRGLYKPAAWFKGILFPLVSSGTCTLREANIISGVLVRISIPVLHSAAAIQGLCQIAAQEASAGTEGGGATNVFIKALLDKKYALPYQVIDSLVFHFLRFRSDDPASVDPEKMLMKGEAAMARDAKLPVIWHQCLLSFAQRYRDNITEDQREALLDLLLTKGHSSIGPEVRRELLAGRGRGVAVEMEPPSMGGDDTMMMD